MEPDQTRKDVDLTMRKSFKRLLSLALSSALLMGCIAIPAGAAAPRAARYLPDNIVGSLENAYMLRNGYQSYQQSTYDLQGGNNDSYRMQYGENNYIGVERTLLNVTGPGVVTRLWFAGNGESMNGSNIKIYIDGASQPIVNTSIVSLCRGQVKPFVRPWTGYDTESSGGSYVNLPIVFAKSIKVVAVSCDYYNINYTLLPKDMEVESFKLTDEPIVPEWFTAEPGEPCVTVDGEAVESKTVSLTPGQETEVYGDEGAGKVTGMNILFPRIREAVNPSVGERMDGKAIRIGGNISFDMALDPSNTGAWLKARVIGSYQNMSLRVYVDGEDTGVWDMGAKDSMHRLKEVFYPIDGKYTAGKDRISVKMEVVAIRSGPDCAIYGAWIYSNTADGVIPTDGFLLSSSSNAAGFSVEEKAHNLAVEGLVWAGTNNPDGTMEAWTVDLSQYPFPVGAPEKLHDDMRAFKDGSVTFSVDVSAANTGVILKKRFDNRTAQSLKVTVDGQAAGTWSTAASEYGDAYKLANATFAIPAALTSGKSKITVKLESTAEANLYKLWAYSEVAGKYTQTDSIDIGEDHAAEETAHAFAITGQTKAAAEENLCYATAGVLKKAWQERLDQYHASEVDADDYVHNTGIRVYYDGETTPSIDAALDMFFAMGTFGLKEVRAQTQGIREDGTLYFYLPMPYEKSISIRLYRKDSAEKLEEIKCDVTAAPMPADTDFSQIGYLKTQNYIYDKPVKGQPMQIVKAEGSGHFIGVVQSVVSDTMGCLEGDEIVYVDGSKSHTLHGTGTEDLYMGAWYFNAGPSSNKFHGCTLIDDGKLARASAYRLMVNDPVSFRDGIDMTIEHGGHNDMTYLNSNNLAFYYHNPNPTLGDTSAVTTTGADAASKVVAGGSVERTVTGRLEGNYFGQKVTITERLLRGKSQMTLTIPEENAGVLLRRTFLMDLPDNTKQAANVYVDGEFVGVWQNGFERGTTTAPNIIRYDDFILPAEVTAGKSSIKVEFETMNAGCVFSEAGYTVRPVLGTAVKTEKVPVTGVTVDKTESELYVGGTLQLTAAVQPAEATNPGVEWYSNNPEVATVDANGLVTAVAGGKAMIAAMTVDGSKTAYCAVTVKYKEGDQQPQPQPDRVGWQTIENKKYYFVDKKPVAGWKQIEGKWYLFDRKGVMQTGWAESNGKSYLLSSDGVMQTGWQLVANVWYFFDANGAMKTGWQQIGGKWYYFGSNGKMQTGWYKVGSQWYFSESSGAMVTGWRKLGKWYLFGSNGAMKTGWQKVGSKWYYLGSDGKMRTGWYQVGKTWYYAEGTGAMATGWKKIGTKWYWFETSGKMIASSSRKIGGKTYRFNTSGVCLNP